MVETQVSLESREIEVMGLELYRLAIPGVPVVAEGEGLRIKDRGRIELARVDRSYWNFGVSQERFKKMPVSNMRLKVEDGKVTNLSYLCEVEGYSNDVIAGLSEKGDVSVRVLRVAKELAKLSGSEYMLEVGFNEGEGELVIQRLLLPPEFGAEVAEEKLGEIWWGKAEKLKEAGFRAWDWLEVDRFDEEWDKRVKDYLLGNVRDLDREVGYRMVEGRKLVFWQEQWMWAGLLSDVNDIDRFLIEEVNLALLSSGEVMVTYYEGHGGGGGMSAATKGELPKDQVIGDVQMMGENGEISQRAVEGSVGEIEGLVGELVNKMKEEHGLVELGLGERGRENMSEWVLEAGVGVGGVVILTGEAGKRRELVTMTEELGTWPVVETMASEIKEVQEMMMNNESWVEPPGVMVEEFTEVYKSGLSELSEGWGEGVTEVMGEIETGFDNGDGGDDLREPDPESPGGLVLRPKIEVSSLEEVIEEEMGVSGRVDSFKEEVGETEEMVVIKEERVREKGQEDEPRVKVSYESKQEVVKAEVVEERRVEKGNEEVPRLDWIWEAMKEEDMPVWQGLELSVPVKSGLELFGEASELSEGFLRDNNMEMFEWINDYASVVVALLYAMLGNKLVRLRVPVEVAGGVVRQQRVI